MDIERFKREHVALMRTVSELRELVHAGMPMRSRTKWWP